MIDHSQENILPSLVLYMIFPNYKMYIDCKPPVYVLDHKISPIVIFES